MRLAIRLFWQVAIIALLLSATTYFIYGAANATLDDQDRVGATVVAVLITVACFSAIVVIVKMMRREGVIRRTVGLLPYEIDEWKWNMRAGPIVRLQLGELARQLSAVNERERELLADPSTPPEDIKQIEKDFKSFQKKFWRMYDAFRVYKIELDLAGDSWKDYLPKK